MSSEATIQTSLQISKSGLEYQSRPTSFRADVTGKKGPTPGAITVAVLGTSITFSELTTPGFCRIQNLDDTHFVEVGIYDPELNRFYPLLELQAGETYVFRFSRNLQEEYGITGTGTFAPGANRLRLKADTAACSVLVEAFEA